MQIDKRTIIVVGASTAIGFIGDVLTYSLAASKGSGFKLVIPKGMALVNLILLGVVTGVIIDVAIKQIEDSQKFEEEKRLEELVAVEKKKIVAGQLTGKKPVAVNWV